MLKIFTDPGYAYNEAPLSPLVLPWYRDFQFCKNRSCKDVYIENGLKYFHRTSIDEADYIVSPVSWVYKGNNEAICRLNKLAKAHNKPLIVFYETDPIEPLPEEFSNAIIFRTSLNRSKCLKNEYAFPAFIEYDQNYTLETIAWSEGPRVGFCGYVDNSFYTKSKLKSFFKRVGYQYILANPKLNYVLNKLGIYITKHEGRKIRTQALALLNQDARIYTDFISRDKHYNGLGDVSPEVYQKHFEESRKTFRENILSNHYTLAPRGGGNYSYRLYEILAFGRVPVFINTDCLLPYHDTIPWKEHCIWVEEKDICELPDRIIEFHQGVGIEAFKKLQYDCHVFWKEYLSLDGFFRHFHEHDCFR